MTVTYVQQTWVDYDPTRPLSAARLNHIEAGIAAAGAGGGGAGGPSNFVTKTANYTGAAGDFVLADTSGGGFTVTLPASAAVGDQVAVKKTSSDGNTLTIARPAAGSIDGATTAITTTQYAGAIFECAGSDVWFVSASMSTTGPQGEQGDTGATGATGAAGPAGTTVVGTVTQSATPAINTDNMNVASITGLAQAITSMTTNLTGTPVDGQTLIIRITDNGTPRAFTLGAKFEPSTVPLPTTTVANVMLMIGCIWNTVTSKWRVVAVA